jgi:hypothetical protein
MNNSSIIMVIPLIVMLWILIKTLLPNYIKDSFREQLFSLRNDLFNYSYEHNKKLFETSAYRDLEGLINATIQYTEKIKPSIMFIIFIKSKKEVFDELSRQKDKMQKSFEKSLGLIDVKDAQKLRNIRKRLEKKLGVYFLFSSWILLIISFITLILTFVVIVIGAVFSVLFKSIREFQSNAIKSMKGQILSNIRIVEVSACLDNR